MIIGIDGACKRNGQPDCVSLGAIWLKDDIGNFMYTSKTEKESTNQRGEINGLISLFIFPPIGKLVYLVG